MAVEGKRGCGFRKVGGLYLVSDGPGVVCDRLPFVLKTCPCCGAGIKPSRGFTWVDPIRLFEGDHDGKGECTCPVACPACYPAEHFAHNQPVMGAEITWKLVRIPAGLLWIGEEHYATPGAFLAEGAAQGLSRRISKLPNGFVIGETWVFLAHRKAKPGEVDSKLFEKEPGFLPGIFLAIRPQRVERIVKQSELDHYREVLGLYGGEAQRGEPWSKLVDKGDEVFWKFKRDEDRGLTMVPVPDGDPDHKA